VPWFVFSGRLFLGEEHPLFSASIRFLFGFSIGASLLLAASVRAQDEKPDMELINKKKTLQLLQKADEEYRLFFKRPEKTVEYWAAMKFEMELGKFDLAALHLKLMLGKEPHEETDKDLVRIENAEGLSAFLRLRDVKKWSDHPPFQMEAVESVELLIDRLTKALEKHLGDPERIRKFIKQLDSPRVEERAFAFQELKRTKERCVPFLVESLRNNLGNSLGYRIVEAMQKFDPEIVPAFLEVFKAADEADAKDTDVRLVLLDLVRKRGDVRAVPYLWHLSASKQYPEAVRTRAREVLAALTNTDVTMLPPAKEVLVDLAEKYYRHQIRFAPGQPIRVWPWNGKEISTKPIVFSPIQAEEFFGARYARQALELDPTYKPAQVILLSLLLERMYLGELDQSLLKPMPAKLQNLLATIDSELVMGVLERALDDHQPAVALPLIQALGERGETRAARLNAGGSPRGLVRALYDNDRRVQFAAALAMLRLPNTPVPVAGSRLVEVCSRFIASGEQPKALALAIPEAGKAKLRMQLKEAGLNTVIVDSLKEAFDKLKASADYDAVFIDYAGAGKELPFVLAQLRADPDQGGLPIFVIVNGEGQERSVQKSLARYRNVFALRDGALAIADELKAALESGMKTSQGAMLSPTERKMLSKVALDILWRMARGEIQGYDLRPTLDSLQTPLRSPEDALQAIEILGSMPGPDVQNRLAGVALDPNRAKLRIPAAVELNRHVQKFGLLLTRAQLDNVKSAHKAADDETLRGQYAILLGTLRSTPQQTGTQLFQFRPDPPMPPMPKEKEKEKEEK
jgi:CheY-like chemotaxis protein